MPVCADQLCYVCDASHGCPATDPVCDADAQSCGACAMASDCAGFADTPLCDATSGACVECLASTDCPDTMPVCDQGACRACAADSDCDSGACGDGGMCVTADAVLYVSPSGSDAGTCTAAMPCTTIGRALAIATTQRNHIVLAPGTYEEAVTIATTTTSAPRVTLDGHGATIDRTVSSGIALQITDVDADIRDVSIAGGVGPGVVTRTAAVTLEHVQVQVATRDAIVVGSSLTLHDVVVSHGAIGLDLGPVSLLVADGLEIYNVGTGITDGTVSSASVQLANLLIHDTTDLAIDLSMSFGSISFATVADGGSQESGTHFVLCGSSLALKSSIVWTPAGAPRVTVSGCVQSNNLVGPSSVSGMPVSDPQFVDENARDYHLMSSSPAIDLSTAGPATDIEGTSRPQGSGYDLGAYEYKP
ncbi:MAG TPA: choice-of-anchor Q domain-containing protein [Kofleriaceae bacterium]